MRVVHWIVAYVAVGLSAGLAAWSGMQAASEPTDAYIKAIGSRSQHKIISAISHRMAFSLSVSIPRSSAMYRPLACSPVIVSQMSECLMFSIIQRDYLFIFQFSFFPLLSPRPKFIERFYVLRHCK